MSAVNPTLYLLPGLLCDAAAFAPQIAALDAMADIRVADFSGLNSFSAMAQSVLDQAPPKFSVLGHSMGGRVAVEIAHMAPQRIQRLCLMDLSVEPLRAGEFEARMALVDQAENEGMDWLAQWWLGTFAPAGMREDSPLGIILRSMVLRHSLADYRNQITAAVTRQDQTQYLSQIRQKVLLVCGAEDMWSTPAQHAAIAANLADATVELIEGAGHMPTLEAADRVNQVLTRWWQEPVNPANAG